MGFVMRIQLTDILRNGSLKNDYENGKATGYSFAVRLAYYRGHFLSVIDELGVETDGTAIPAENIRFCINGKEFRGAELGEAYHEFWSIKQAAVIRVRQAGGLTAGTHHIKLRLMLRNPYLPQPGADDMYTPVDSSDEKDMSLPDWAV